MLNVWWVSSNVLFLLCKLLLLMEQGFHLVFWSKPPKHEAYKVDFPGILKPQFKLFCVNNEFKCWHDILWIF